VVRGLLQQFLIQRRVPVVVDIQESFVEQQNFVLPVVEEEREILD
jgi:hypothetical protein